ncbi:FAD binding domain-containing protein [Multifurca ochricompacta]|uniref:FAD binding domain-containing protein n=1 Tax=Multifurca ochricompacta TaxID=376703 RepID=A0AAD4QJD8_9AGAM|nr:FAD binding domain-containing protein [Multifurca ochricompacta]
MTTTTDHRPLPLLILLGWACRVFCANALVRAGLNVRVIDKRPVKVAAGQADGIQPRTIEVLQSYGLADKVLSQAAFMIMAAFYNPGPNGIECIGRVPDVTAPTARYPYEVTLHQGAIEGIFLDSMKKEGLEVERPIIPVSLQISEDPKALADPHAYPVKVVLKHLDWESGEDTETVRAKFVVGADGAHSWVRKTLGISMDGEQTDITPSEKTDFPDTRNKSAIHSVNGSCMIIPREGDKIRLYIQLSNKDAVDPETGRVNLHRYDPKRHVQAIYDGCALDKVEWWTIYQIGQRVASRFTTNERVFIAGDACHTHSPKAGQGMNASMNDTHNLAWKLTHVLRGWADISLLKTYEFERRKYAQDLISFDKTFLHYSRRKSAMTAKVTVQHTRNLLDHRADLSAAASNLIIGQRLLPHVLVRAADAREVNIQDLAPADTRFKLFVFPGDHTQTVAAYLDNSQRFFYKRRDAFDVITILQGTKSTVNYLGVPLVLRSHWTKVLLDDTDITGSRGGRIHERYGIDRFAGALVVVRPDGYVGTVAPLDKLATLDTYFSGFMLSD